MYVGVVQGKCVSTIKNNKLNGLSLFTVQKKKKGDKVADDMLVVVDTIGCSVGEEVLVTTGRNVKYALSNQDVPVDAVIIGIIDHPAEEFDEKDIK